MGWRALSPSSPPPAPASASWLSLHNLRSRQGNGHACHGKRDVGGGQMTPGDAAGVAPLFTNSTSSNLGLPRTSPFHVTMRRRQTVSDSRPTHGAWPSLIGESATSSEGPSTRTRAGHRTRIDLTARCLLKTDGKDALQLAVVPRRVAAGPCVGGTTCV
jgi:hypothetical protein